MIFDPSAPADNWFGDTRAYSVELVAIAGFWAMFNATRAALVIAKAATDARRSNDFFRFDIALPITLEGPSGPVSGRTRQMSEVWVSLLVRSASVWQLGRIYRAAIELPSGSLIAQLRIRRIMLTRGVLKQIEADIEPLHVADADRLADALYVRAIAGYSDHQEGSPCDTGPCADIDRRRAAPCDRAIRQALACEIFVFLLISQRHIRQRYAAKTHNFFETSFLCRWRSLRSQQDEAINALRAITPLRLRLFRKNFLVQPAKALIVMTLTLGALFGILMAGVFLYRYGISKEWVVKTFEFFNVFGVLPVLNPADLPDTPETVDIFSALQFARQNPVSSASSLIVWVFIGPIIFAILFLLFTVLHFIAYLVGLPASFFLNRLTAYQVRRTAFGNDTVGERAVEVAAVPEGCSANYGLVPAEIETVLADFSDKNAVKTLASARKILGLNKETQSERDVGKIMAEQMSWHELIHTAYFDVDEFARLIAYVLHKVGLAPLSEHFKADPDLEKIKLAYDHLPPLAVQTTDVYSKRKSRPLLGLGTR
jgi:hypothetical protein